MNKVYILNGLDCANCAAKIEDKVSKVKGVKNVCVNFMSKKMIMDIDELNLQDTLNQIEKVVNKIEPTIDIRGEER